MSGIGSGDRLAAFLAGMACGALLQWAAGPPGRRLAGFTASGRGAGAARPALDRIHGLLGEIRGLMGSPHGSTRDGSPG